MNLSLAVSYVGTVDIIIFVLFVVAVISIGLWKSRGEKLHSEDGASDYFLAGRGLTWWLIGFSLIAANISTEQFVGMSGKAADWLGMAIASYEWMAAVTLVVVAFVFLPKFLRSGIYTIPEFLQYRYNTFARTVMAVVTLIILVGVPTASVIFSGAKVITGNFQGVSILGLDLGNITVGCWIIGILAAVYVFVGGLKACAWADLLQGSALIIGGVVIAYFAMHMLGDADPNKLIETARNDQVTVQSLQDADAMGRFVQLNQGALPEGKLHMVREKTDPEIPWTALVLGLWIPNFFYWGLNQYITQRTLGSKSLSEGQKGVVFSAFLKLLIPFVVVIPGILAFNLFSSNLKDDAINRNAQVLSEKSPAFYQSLSDSVKPDPNDERNVNIIEKINKNLDEKPKADQAIQLYTFTETFAELHPKDATQVLERNADLLRDLVVHVPQVSQADAQKYQGKIVVVPHPGDDEQTTKALKDTISKMPFHVVIGPTAVPTNADTASYCNAIVGTAKNIDNKKYASEKLVGHDYDNAFPTLIRELLPVGKGIKGFVLAAIFGAVVSSLASMLNSASTIATMDLYNKVRKNASQYELVTSGRVFVVIFVLIAMIIAPFLGRPEFGGIFTFIQEFQGFISPGILAIFLFGLLIHRAPRYIGTVGLLLNPVLYGLFKFSPHLPVVNKMALFQAIAERSFLDRMGLCFIILMVVLGLLTAIRPLKVPVVLPVNEKMDMTQSKGALIFGIFVCVATVALYAVFW